jgi:protein-S-isoprenylcysteine O-methyltransferase Ste14
MISRLPALLYGLAAYVAFLVAILYAIGFLSNSVVPKSVDSGSPAQLGEAMIVNVLLLLVFAVQHTIMARPAFKAWWARLIPPPIERSTFVLVASLLLLLLFWQWRPLPETVWSVEPTALRTFLWCICGLGWATVFYSSFLIDHFDLFGMRQVTLYFFGKENPSSQFVARSLYRWIRHPLMAGFILAFWATPDMSQGHIIFALVSTAYIFFGTVIEEHDLVQLLGEDYRRYRQQTPMLIPWTKRN